MEVKQVNSEYRLFFFEYRLFKEFAIKQEMGRFCWLQLGQTTSIKGKDTCAQVLGGLQMQRWQLLVLL